MSIDIKGPLRTYLVNVAGITALVGTRIYPTIAPQNTLEPYITFQRIGYDNLPHMASPSTLDHALFQLDCWGTSSLQVEDVVQQLLTSLDGYRGLMDTVKVAATRVDSLIDGIAGPDDASDEGTHRTTLGLEVWYFNA